MGVHYEGGLFSQIPEVVLKALRKTLEGWIGWNAASPALQMPQDGCGVLSVAAEGTGVQDCHIRNLLRVRELNLGYTSTSPVGLLRSLQAILLMQVHENKGEGMEIRAQNMSLLPRSTAPSCHSASHPP